MKHSHDFDSVFKTLKFKHRRLFVFVINEIFGTGYTDKDEITAIPTEGVLSSQKGEGGAEKIAQRESDFLIRIGNAVYLLECQSFNDGTMAIRIAEYAFLAASEGAAWENGSLILKLPHYAVIYVRSDAGTPRATGITWVFSRHRKAARKSAGFIPFRLFASYCPADNSLAGVAKYGIDCA